MQDCELRDYAHNLLFVVRQGPYWIAIKGKQKSVDTNQSVAHAAMSCFSLVHVRNVSTRTGSDSLAAVFVLN